MLNREEFECGIGSCALMAASRFIEAELLKHLEVSELHLLRLLSRTLFQFRVAAQLTNKLSFKLHHGLPHGEINKAINAVKISSDKTVKRTDLTSPWRDCKHCEEAVSNQKSQAVQNTAKAGVLDGFRNHTLSLDGFLGARE